MQADQPSPPERTPHETPAHAQGRKAEDTSASTGKVSSPGGAGSSRVEESARPQHVAESFGVWQCVECRQVSDHRIFELHEHLYCLHDSDPRPFVVLDCPDWVNVIPITADGQVVFIRQFRHGVRADTLEVPGGMVDPGESPAAAALRELREETGFEGAAAEELGYVFPNPAIQNNRTYSYVARPVRQVGPPMLDPFEHVEVVLHPLAEVPRLLAAGAIRHSLVVAAFALLGIAAEKR